MRVVSLIASATEMVSALGCGEWLVGRSHECDWPPEVMALPQLTAPRFQVAGTPGEIDRRVKEVLASALSVYQVDAEKLAALAPDVIVTQSQCEVCAVSLRDVEQAICNFTASRPRVVSLEPNSLDDVWRDLGRVAEALGVPARGAELTARLRERIAAIATRAQGRARPRVACIEWVEPLMAAGNWMPTLVELAGGENLFGEAGRHSPWMTWDELAARDPDVIVALPCGFDLARTRLDMPILAAHPGWSRLSAVRAGRVFVTDGNQYFNRPGPRLVESLEILAEIFHPDEFSFGHRGAAWEPWSQ